MAYIPRSSFDQTPGAIPMQVKKKHSIRVFSLLSTIILVVTIATTAGLFLYKNQLEKKILSAQTTLNSASDSTSEKKIHEIEVYDRKLTAAQSLLNNHIATTRLFNALEDSAKQTVRYTTLEYKYDPGFDAELTLGGDTREFESVALQKMQFLKDNVFSDYVVRDITSGSFNKPLKDTSSRQETKGTSEELGVEFKVVGVFKNSELKYSGGPYKESLPDAENTNSSSTQASGFNSRTPVTTTSNVNTTI